MLVLPSILSHSIAWTHSGADLDALVREAALKALQEDLESGTQNAPLVLPRHMEYAMQSVFPSVSKQVGGDDVFVQGW